MEKLLTFLFGHKCPHCNKNRTRRKDSAGNLVCFDCRLDQIIKAEPQLFCPKCNTLMNKNYIEGTITDICPKCGGVFLDNGEMFGFLKDTLTPRGA